MLLNNDEAFKVINDDCILGMSQMPAASVDLAVFSPPFPSLYAYTSESGDIGNSEEKGESKLHLSFFFKALRRVLKPGRVAICHCMQIPRLKRAGGQGLHDFRGMLIRLGERAGLIYTYDWAIRKNPQAQAIRSRSRELQFSGLESDRARSRGTLLDYLIKFVAPGENEHAVEEPGEVSRSDWIDYAEGCWGDIIETDTLNVAGTKDPEDTKHICPLQLSVYERCIRLFSDPGEVVLDPFAGIGSCGYVCLGGKSPSTGRRLETTRRFIGIELKPSWASQAIRNCESAMRQSREAQRTLFDSVEAAIT